MNVEPFFNVAMAGGAANLGACVADLDLNSFFDSLGACDLGKLFSDPNEKGTMQI